jgi:positive regulator of sigma E activity
MLNTFVRLTILLAICIVAVIVGLFALKVIVIAAVIAALVIGVLFVVNFIRRIGARPALPTRR